MKKLSVILMFYFIASISHGQLSNEIREEKEIGKAFHFQHDTDSVDYFLDFVFTGFLGYDAIKTTFTFWTINQSTSKSDTLQFRILCSWAEDIIDVDSTGYEYKAKICSAYRNKRNYTFELNENRADYSSVQMKIFDPYKSRDELRLLLNRIDKE